MDLTTILPPKVQPETVSHTITFLYTTLTSYNRQFINTIEICWLTGFYDIESEKIVHLKKMPHGKYCEKGGCNLNFDRRHQIG